MKDSPFLRPQTTTQPEGRSYRRLVGARVKAGGFQVCADLFEQSG